MKRVILSFAAFMMLAGSASAQGESPFQLSLFDPVQIVSHDKGIKGIRLNLIYTRNTDVSGLDFGFILNRTDGELSGVQFALVGMTEGDATGWVSNFVSIVEGEMTGLQGAFGGSLFNSAGSTNGAQVGLINIVEGRMGFLQLGFVNVAGSAEGIQIGLFNLIKSKEKFSWLPIVNWQF